MSHQVPHPGVPSPQLFLAGATASGKTAVALELARPLDAEIVSVDSRQVYRDLDVGTAKPTAAEQARARHHLVDCLEIDELCSAGRFRDLYRAVLLDLARRGRPALAVGGTGLYWEACTRGLHVLPPIDPEVRASVERFTRDHGVAASYERLRELDPSGAAGVPERNRQRVMRALELVTQAGRPLADLFRGEREGRVHPPIPSFVLQRERADLYARIDRRCEQMLADGLLEETRRLLERGLAADAPGMRTLGYREMAEHLRGETTWDEARDRFLRHSRQYGKRQETWFRHRLAGAVTIAVSAEDPPESVAGRILSLVADAGS